MNTSPQIESRALPVAAHTPGPWSVGLTLDGHAIYRCIEGRNETKQIGATVDSDFSIDEESSNARLIAAAPELLGFAESFLAWAEQMRSVNRSLPGMEARENEARAAIAKAKGL